jgi:hypothetical protein
MTLWKIDENGNLVWGPSKNSTDYKYGGTEAYSLTQGIDGSLMLVGYTSEWNWSYFNYQDYPYIVRVDSSGNQFAGSGKTPDTHEGDATAVISTSDGGYVLSGYGKLSSGSGYGIWVQKMDSAENSQLTESFELPADEKAYSMASTATGGYIVAGSTNSIGEGGEDFLIAPLPLSVSISPLNASITLSQSVPFTSTVHGGLTPYSYQWYLDRNPVSSATADTWLYLPSTNGIHYVYLRVTDATNNIAQSETARVSVATVPVGGYTVSFNKQTTAGPLTLYLALSAMLAVFLVGVRRRRVAK